MPWEAGPRVRLRMVCEDCDVLWVGAQLGCFCCGRLGRNRAAVVNERSARLVQTLGIEE